MRISQAAVILGGCLVGAILALPEFAVAADVIRSDDRSLTGSLISAQGSIFALAINRWVPFLAEAAGVMTILFALGLFGWVAATALFGAADMKRLGGLFLAFFVWSSAAGLAAFVGDGRSMGYQAGMQSVTNAFASGPGRLPK